MGCMQSRSRSISNRSQFSPANEIKSSAALIRCLSTNEEISFDASTEDKVKRSLESIIAHASGNNFNETVYLDVKDAVDSLFSHYPEAIPRMEHLSSTALRTLKPFGSEPKLEDNPLEGKQVSIPSKKSPPSSPPSHLLASASGSPIALPSRVTKGLRPIHSTFSMADDDDDGYGFVDLTEHD